MHLAAKRSLAGLRARGEDGREREIVGQVMCKHCGEQFEALAVKALVRIAGNEGGPGHEVSFRHFVEQLVCDVEAAAFRVHVDEVVGDLQVGVVGGGEVVAVG